MATSGSVDFSVNRNEIIESAFRVLGVLGQGRSITAKETSDGAEALNMMIKSWQARDVGLWLHQRCTLFIEKDVYEYNLGSSASDANCTASFVQSTLSADEASSATVLDITSTTGMSASDNIGVILDDETIHWDTIASVDSSTQVTVDTGLAGAASSGNRVYAYTTKINRPLRVIEARHKGAGASGTEIPLDLLSRDRYMNLSDKTSSGKTTQAFFDPQTGSSVLSLWPVPENSDETIKLTIQTPIQDFDASTDEADYPQEWFNALKFGLAAYMGHEYNINLNKLNSIIQMASVEFSAVSGFDEEREPLYLAPNFY